MRDVLETLERWAADGAPVAIATVVGTERSAPRDPGAVLAVSESGDVAGSVTGGCVEPAVYGEAREVLAGGAPRLKTYGIADEEAFEVGLPCGGTVHIFVDRLDPELVAPIADAVREERPIALEIRITGDDAGAKRLVALGRRRPRRRAARARRQRDRRHAGGADLRLLVRAPARTCTSSAPSTTPPRVASIGRYLGYRVTVCDARAKFVTPERFPDVDELVVEWPDKFLRERARGRADRHLRPHPRPQVRRPGAQGRARDERPATSARWARRRTNASRAERLRAEGVSDEDIARIHAPIGLKIGSRTPEEVAVAIAAADRPGHALPQAPGPGGRSLVKLENSFQVDAPPEKAWALLMDVPRIVPVHAGRQARRGRRRLPLEGDDGGEARADRAHVRHRRRANRGRRGRHARRARSQRPRDQEPRPRERHDRLVARVRRTAARASTSSPTCTSRERSRSTGGG